MLRLSTCLNGFFLLGRARGPTARWFSNPKVIRGVIVMGINTRLSPGAKSEKRLFQKTRIRRQAFPIVLRTTDAKNSINTTKTTARNGVNTVNDVINDDFTSCLQNWIQHKNHIVFQCDISIRRNLCLKLQEVDKGDVTRH